MEVLIIGVMTVTLVLLTYTIGNDKGYDNGYEKGYREALKNEADKE